MANAGKLFVTVGAKISDFEKKMSKVSSKLKNVGDKMKETGESFSTHIGAPMAAVGALSLKAANDWQTAQGMIQAQTGKSAKEVKGLMNIAKDLWLEGFGDNVQESAEAVALVSRNLQGLSKQDLGVVTKQALIIQKAFGADISESIKTARSMMTNFGISAEKAMDLITVGFQKGGDNAGDLLDTLHEYAPQFTKLGISAEQALAILINGSKSGAFNMDKMADAVKEFSIRAVDGSKTTAQGFKMIGLDADEMAQKIAKGGDSAQQAFQATLVALSNLKDPVAQQQAGVALFGTQWEDLGMKAVLSLTNTKNSLGQVEGATLKAGQAMSQNFGVEMRKKWAQLVESLQPLGFALMNIASTVIPPLVAGLTTLANWFGNLNPTIQTVIASIGLFVVALGPMMTVMGVVIGNIGKFIGVALKIIPTMTSVIKIIKSLGIALRFLALNPVGLVITIIGSLIAIGIELYKHWDTVRAKAAQFGNSISKIFSNIKNWVSEKVGGMVNSVTSKVSHLISSIKSAFGKVLGIIWSPFQKAYDKVVGIINKIKSFFSNLDLSFPKIKLPPLPHFKISGHFSLMPPSVPHLSVKWYAKGGIVDGAQLIGAGEKGPEAIIPLTGNAMKPFAEAIAESMPDNNGGGTVIVPVYLDGKEIARVTAPYMDVELGKRRNRRSRARGG